MLARLGAGDASISIVIVELKSAALRAGGWHRGCLSRPSECIDDHGGREAAREDTFERIALNLAARTFLDDGVWVSYILGAPEFVNRDFRELFTDGVPVATPLVGKRN